MQHDVSIHPFPPTTKTPTPHRMRYSNAPLPPSPLTPPSRPSPPRPPGATGHVFIMCEWVEGALYRREPVCNTVQPTPLPHFLQRTPRHLYTPHPPPTPPPQQPSPRLPAATCSFFFSHTKLPALGHEPLLHPHYAPTPREPTNATRVFFCSKTWLAARWPRGADAHAVPVHAEEQEACGGATLELQRSLYLCV